MSRGDRGSKGEYPGFYGFLPIGLIGVKMGGWGPVSTYSTENTYRHATVTVAVPHFSSVASGTRCDSPM